MLERVETWAKSAVNGQGRSWKHVAIGAGVCVGVVVASALVAGFNAPTKANPKVKRQYDRLEQPDMQPPRKTFALVWPPLFTVMALSGLRIWNAPRGLERTRALVFWGATQALQALWMA